MCVRNLCIFLSRPYMQPIIYIVTSPTSRNTHSVDCSVQVDVLRLKKKINKIRGLLIQKGSHLNLYNRPMETNGNNWTLSWNVCGSHLMSRKVVDADCWENWGARGVMVIVVGNEHGDTSSNPGRGWVHFT